MVHERSTRTGEFGIEFTTREIDTFKRGVDQRAERRAGGRALQWRERWRRGVERFRVVAGELVGPAEQRCRLGLNLPNSSAGR